MIRYLCVPFIVFALSLLARPADAEDPGASRKPNIVIVLADDLGYGDPQCYQAESKIPTPNIDRLASQGMRLTDAHTPASVCSPTRYALLTGRYAWRSRMKSGVLGPYSAPLIEPDRLTLAKMLKAHGYTTACIGKWHLGMQWATKSPDVELPPLWDRGFDQSQIVCLVDWAATIAAIVGYELPDDAAEDSYDLGPTLRDPSRAVRDDVVHHSASGMFAIRRGEWKLIAGRGSGGWTRVKTAKEDPPGQLYRLADDPQEQDNLYHQEPEMVRQLTERLKRYQQQGRSRPMSLSSRK